MRTPARGAVGGAASSRGRGQRRCLQSWVEQPPARGADRPATTGANKETLSSSGSVGKFFSGFTLANPATREARGRTTASELAPLSWPPARCGGAVIPRIDLAARGACVGIVGDSLSENLAVTLLCALRSADPAVGKRKRLPPRCATRKYVSACSFAPQCCCLFFPCV